MEHKPKDLYNIVFPDKNIELPGPSYHYFASNQNSYRKGNMQKKQQRAKKKINYAKERAAVAEATEQERERRIAREEG